MRRYLSLLYCFIKNCIIRDMTFRLNFFTNMFTDLTYNVLKILFIEIIFLQVNELAGLNKYHYLFLFGTSFLVNALYMLFVFFNHIQIPFSVQMGNLDYILTKPIAPQFLMSFRYFNLAGIGNIVFGVYLIAYSVHKLNITFTLSNLLMYFVLLICGFILYYSFSLFLNTMAFWTVKTNSFVDILVDVCEIMKYPPDIFPHLIQIILTFVIPLFMIAAYPAKITLQLVPWGFAMWNLGISIGVLFLVSKFLRFALKHYSSASS